MIQVNDVAKSFGTLKAVDGVTFNVSAGETFGLLGPNGAGKSTVMNMLVGVIPPDAGVVRVGGMVDPMRPEVRRQVGLAPQALSLYGDLTASENLHFFGRLYNLSGPTLKQRVGWALDFAQLTDRAHHRLSTYSGGMQRRLNLAVALIHDPPVLLFDEPTVGVDPQSRNHIFDTIAELKKSGKTIVYTTHYMEEAERLCDRVAIIDHGKFLACDTVDRLIERYGGGSVIIAEFTRPPADRASLPGMWTGDQLRIETADPLPVISRLLGMGEPLPMLRLERPDLETVFLSLTGRRLRD